MADSRVIRWQMADKERPVLNFNSRVIRWQMADSRVIRWQMADYKKKTLGMDLNIVKFQQFLSMVRRRCNTLDGGAWTLNLKSTLIQTCKVIRLSLFIIIKS